MEAISTETISKSFLKGKLSDYAQLIKVRLSFLVVFSASMAYLWTTNRHADALTIWLVSIGGFLITGSANTFNQVLEKDSDKLMKRTCKRPLPAERMSVNEAIFFGIIIGLMGLFILSRVSIQCSLLGLFAMILYASVYTPLKKITHLSVIPGAIAGSMPVVIGCVAATGRISSEALLLFMIQFIWQFPHTWSIAWLLDDDYTKAGIKMMPMAGGKTRTSAIIIMLSTFLIIPAALVFYMYKPTGIFVTILLALAGCLFSLFAYKLYRTRTAKSALGLMFGSFAYLPFVLIVLVIAKFI
jgi:protoheme IX farnesyltransferase